MGSGLGSGKGKGKGLGSNSGSGRGPGLQAGARGEHLALPWLEEDAQLEGHGLDNGPLAAAPQAGPVC